VASGFYSHEYMIFIIFHGEGNECIKFTLDIPINDTHESLPLMYDALIE